MPVKLEYQTIKNLKNPGRYTDALVKGLHLWVKSSGAKYWIFRFTHGGKQANMSLGAFPALSIADARIKAQQAREELAKGVNPIEVKKAAKVALIEANNNVILFKDFAQSFIDTKRAEWSNAKHANQWIYTLTEFAFPIIGDKPLDHIETEDILKILTPIWTSKTETASRLRGRIELILAAATARKLRSGTNPALWRGHLQTILPTPNKIKEVVHHKALHYRTVPDLISKLREIATMGALALEFTILNASRTGEVIGGLKDEIEEDIWTIPASRMKAKRMHRVPLCERTLEILSIATAMDPSSKYLFSRNGRPLSNMAMPMLLRRYSVDATVHGFRSAFRDWVSEETNHTSEVAEMALAHTIADKSEAAYRRKDLLEKRRTLMNEWQAHCASIQNSNVHLLKAA